MKRIQTDADGRLMTERVEVLLEALVAHQLTGGLDKFVRQLHKTWAKLRIISETAIILLVKMLCGLGKKLYFCAIFYDINKPKTYETPKIIEKSGCRGSYGIVDSNAQRCLCPERDY